MTLTDLLDAWTIARLAEDEARDATRAALELETNAAQYRCETERALYAKLDAASATDRAVRYKGLAVWTAAGKLYTRRLIEPADAV